MTSRSFRAVEGPPPPPLLCPVLSVGVSNVPGAVACLEKDVVAYVSGHCVATCSVDPSYRSKISEPCSSVRAINAMAASNSKQWLAVAEFMVGGQQAPQVTVLNAKNLERRISLRGPGVFKYMHVKFSSDDKHILAVGYDDNQEDSVFHVWEWGASSEPASSCTVPGMIHQVSMHPKFSSNVLTLGSEGVMLWRKGSSGYKRIDIEGMKKMTGATYIDHCWTSDGLLVVASSDRRLQLIEASTVVQVYELDSSVVSLQPLPDNGLAVSMAKGKVGVYRTNKESPKLDVVLSTQVPDGLASSGVDLSVQSMSAGAGGHKVACLLKNGPVLMLNLQFAMASTAGHASKQYSHSNIWEEALPAIHSGAITSMSVAAKRSFLVTASSDDLTVRVWQYSPLRMVLAHFCHHVPTAVGIDPWGRELVICFVDSVRCFGIAEGMLIELATLHLELEDQAAKEMTKCRIAKYNPPGHLLAVVHGEEALDIVIFSTLHHRQLAILKGHYGAINDISWSDDGQYLVSVSDGEVYTWHMETFSRCQSDTAKTCPNSSVACTRDFSTLVVGAGSTGIRVLSTSRTPRAKPRPETAAAAAAAVAGTRGTGSGTGPSVAGSAPGTSMAGNGRDASVSMAGGIPGARPGAGRPSGLGNRPRGTLGDGEPSSGALVGTPLTPTALSVGFESGLSGAGAVPVTSSRRPSRLNVALSGAATGPPSPSALASPGNAPPFVVPGRGIASRERSTTSMSALAGIQGMVSKHMYAGGSDAMLASPGALSMPQTPGPAPSAAELQVRCAFPGLMNPVKGCLVALQAETGELSALVSGQAMGRARVCAMPPNGQYTEYALHSSELTVMQSHCGGRLLFSADVTGCWKLHALLPVACLPALSAANSIAAAAAAAAAATAAAAAAAALSVSPGGPETGGAGSVGGVVAPGEGVAVPPPAFQDVLQGSVSELKQLLPTAQDDSFDIVSVRQVDMSSLKEQARELREKLAKAVEEAEYKLYEREQQIRREVQKELARRDKEGEDLRSELINAKEAYERLQQESTDSEAALREKYEAQIEEERRKLEERLAYEIGRTNEAEKTLAVTKTKFGRKLWEVEEERKGMVDVAVQQAKMLEEQVAAAGKEAEQKVVVALEQMNMEARLDSQLTEERIERVEADAIRSVEAEQRRQDLLLAKYQMQQGLYSKTLVDNEELAEAARQYAKENAALVNQVRGLSEQLNAMEMLWAERDAQQRVKDGEVKDLMQRMEQGQMFTNMAAKRIQELGSELDPLREAKREAQESVAKLEALQFRQAERRHKALLEQEALKKQIESLRAEVKQVKHKLHGREAYFENFTTQLFRTIQTLNHDQWAQVLGRLYEDFKAGKDISNWAKYLPPTPGLAPGAPSIPAPIPAMPSPTAAVAAGSGSAAAAAVTVGAVAGAGVGPVEGVDGEAAAAVSSDVKKALATGNLVPSVKVVGDADFITQLEYRERMLELQAHVRHLEKSITTLKESREKSEAAQKMVIKRLVSENLQVIEEANVYKRDLRSSQDQVERLTAELLQLRRMAPGAAAAAASAGSSGRISASGDAARSSSPSRTHRLARGASLNADIGDAPRELSPADLAAAAAYNNSHNNAAAVAAATAAAVAAGPRPGTSSFPSIPEDRVADQAGRSGSGSGAGLGAPRRASEGGGGGGSGKSSPVPPAPSTSSPPQPQDRVTGEAPSGGWWLDPTMFEVPANLRTILQGSDSPPVRSAIESLPPGADPGGPQVVHVFTPGLSPASASALATSRPATTDSCGVSSSSMALLPSWGGSGGGAGVGGARRAGAGAGPGQQGPRVGAQRKGGVFLTRGFTPQTPAAGAAAGGGGDAGLGGTGQWATPRPATSHSLDSSSWAMAVAVGAAWPGSGAGSTPASGTGPLFGPGEDLGAGLGPGAAAGAGAGGVLPGAGGTSVPRAATAPGAAAGSRRGWGGATGAAGSGGGAAAAGLGSPTQRGPGVRPGTTPGAVPSGAGGTGGTSAAGAGPAAHLPAAYLHMLQGQTKLPSAAAGPGAVRLATLGGGFRSYKQHTSS